MRVKAAGATSKAEQKTAKNAAATEKKALAGLAGRIGAEWPADKVSRKSTASLVPYARNARTHSPEQVTQIAASIREWGFTNPILIDEAGGIIAGHGRVLAALQLGLAEVPVMVAEGWPETKKRAYVIADNKLALNSGWDTEMLALEMEDLKSAGADLGLTGFTGDEIEALLQGAPLEDGAGEDQQANLTDDAGTQIVVGQYRVECPKNIYLKWRDEIRDAVGFEADDVTAEIMRRLGMV